MQHGTALVPWRPLQPPAYFLSASDLCQSIVLLSSSCFVVSPAAYCCCRSIARNVGMSPDELKDAEVPVEHPKERKLAKMLLRFPEVILIMLEELHLHPLCDYMFELSQTFSEFYDNCYCIEKDKATGECTELN